MMTKHDDQCEHPSPFLAALAGEVDQCHCHYRLMQRIRHIFVCCNYACASYEMYEAGVRPQWVNVTVITPDNFTGLRGLRRGRVYRCSRMQSLNNFVEHDLSRIEPE